MPTTYRKVVKYLFSTYVTEHFRAEMDAKMTSSKQPPNINLLEYSHSVWLSIIKCGLVYRSMLKSMFIEGIHESVRHSIRAYCILKQWDHLA